jgi:hypothetical protein
LLDFRRTNRERGQSQAERGRLARMSAGGRDAHAPLPSHKRLLAMILLLGILVIVMDAARRPRVWMWFDGLAAPDAVATKGVIDNRLSSASPQEPADSFVIPKGQPAEKAEKTAEDGRFFPGVRPEWFASIRDNTPSSQAEQACTLPLLDVLQRTDLEKLRKASLGRITYAQLFRQPREYRGQLVTVSGTIRAAHRVELSKNQYGIPEYHQVWLYPIDNRFQPIVVYCLSLPKGFPSGDKIAEEGEVTGFFLKRWAYPTKDEIYLAPTLLAKTLQWQRRPVAAQGEPTDVRWLSLTIAVAAALAMLTAWLIYVRTRTTRQVLSDSPFDPDALRLLEEGPQSQTDASDSVDSREPTAPGE